MKRGNTASTRTPRRGWRKRGLAVVVMLLILAQTLPAVAGGLATPAEAARRLGFSQSDLGYILFDVQSKTVLAEQNADQLFLPASVTKFVTSFAASRILGPDHRFSTLLYEDGSDVYLKGGGDPVLTAADLQSLAMRLKSAPLQKASGGGGPARFFFDASLLPSLPEISARQPLAASYNTGVSALDLDFNRVEVDWTKGPDGAFAFRALCLEDELVIPADWIAFSPAAPALPAQMPFVYAAQRGGRGAGLDGWQYSVSRPRHGFTFLPVKATSLHTAMVFRELTKAAGVALAMPEPGRVPADAVLLGRIDSRPLPEILKGLLRFSNNPSAELVGLATARKLGARPATLAESAGVVTRWLKQQLPKIDWRGFLLVNHSGLSPESRVTPRQMARVLLLAAQEPMLTQALPALSDEGLALVEGEHARGLVGKSGTMDYARALVGYFQARDGRPLGFAIFVFDPAQRAVLDARMDPRVLEPTPAARAWIHRALQLDEALLGFWMASY
jgi:serine-type D-Ala-D-Ala carboxypeptidase/endopeptidase (penicillin-binding protein 4)